MAASGSLGEGATSAGFELTEPNPSGRPTPMRIRSHTTWAYAIILPCVLAPALAFGRSQGEEPATDPQTRNPPSRGEEKAVPIPELALWKAQMVSFGQKACLRVREPGDRRTRSSPPPTTTRPASTTRSRTTRAMRSGTIARPKPRRSTGLRHRNNGNVPGLLELHAGFRMDWEHNSDALSKQAAILLLSTAAYCADATPLEWTARPSKEP